MPDDPTLMDVPRAFKEARSTKPMTEHLPSKRGETRGDRRSAATDIKGHEDDPDLAEMASHSLFQDLGNAADKLSRAYVGEIVGGLGFFFSLSWYWQNCELSDPPLPSARSLPH